MKRLCAKFDWDLNLLFEKLVLVSTKIISYCNLYENMTSRILKSFTRMNINLQL